LVDKDEKRYPITLLREWKQRAEAAVSRGLRAHSHYREIAPGELVLDFSVAEIAAFRELTEEFGCDVERNVRVAAGQGWMALTGAVVRGEDLTGIDIREYHGRGFAYFQIDYLLDLCSKVMFQRFQKCVPYLVVVSDAPEDADNTVRAGLQQRLTDSGLEGYVRIYRFNRLRAKFGL